MAQAGCRWQRSLFTWILDWNYGGGRITQSESDVCVFHCRHRVDTPAGTRDEVLVIGCYVDDLFILSSHMDEYSLFLAFTTSLAAAWDVEDEGEVADLLSIEISSSGSTVTLKQSEYIRRLMERHAPNCIPVCCPLSLPAGAHIQNPTKIQNILLSRAATTRG